MIEYKDFHIGSVNYNTKLSFDDQLDILTRDLNKDMNEKLNTKDKFELIKIRKKLLSLCSDYEKCIILKCEIFKENLSFKLFSQLESILNSKLTKEEKDIFLGVVK